MRRSGDRHQGVLLSIHGLCWVYNWDSGNGQIYDLIGGTSVVVERVREGNWTHSQGLACRALLINTNGELLQAISREDGIQILRGVQIGARVRFMKFSLGFVC